jgi:hypothetical protein
LETTKGHAGGADGDDSAEEEPNGPPESTSTYEVESCEEHERTDRMHVDRREREKGLPGQGAGRFAREQSRCTDEANQLNRDDVTLVEGVAGRRRREPTPSLSHEPRHAAKIARFAPFE